METEQGHFIIYCAETVKRIIIITETGQIISPSSVYRFRKMLQYLKRPQDGATLQKTRCFCNNIGKLLYLAQTLPNCNACVPTKHATYQIVLPIIHLYYFKGKFRVRVGVDG